jgi:F-type H+-transporting ATPase subunit alpha
VELLKQGQFQPQPVEEQVVSLWLGTTGELDAVPVSDIRRFESEFLDHMRRNEEGALAEIRDTGKLSDENVDRLRTVVREFQKGFEASDGSSVVPKEKREEALDEDEVDKESVKVNKPDPKKK